MTLTSRALTTHSIDTVLSRWPGGHCVVGVNDVLADLTDVCVVFHTETSSDVAGFYCTRQIAGFYTVATICGVRGGKVRGEIVSERWERVRVGGWD